MVFLHCPYQVDGFRLLKCLDDIVKLFLNNGSSVNMRNEDESTALTLAALEGHFSIAQILLESGADMELQDYEGNTALKNSARMDYPDIVSILLVRGAHEDVTNSSGENALQFAKKYGSFSAIKMFAAWHDTELRKEMLFEASHEGKTRLVRGLLC